jgi:hypothetical protein
MQPLKPQPRRRLLRNEKAVSPAISTIILTAATVVMILVAMFYASGYLNRRMAENEYSANKQFMVTTGLQIDDIAWVVGRTQTIRYTSQYGLMKFESALDYTFEVNQGSGWILLSANQTGMIMFDMPVQMYTQGNGYFERLSTLDDEFLHFESSSPIVNVYCIEKVPMNEGSFTRIVAVPTVRMINSTIKTGSEADQKTTYYKFYLPTLWKASSNPYLSQAVTLTGTDIQKVVSSGVNQVRINVTFPNSNIGFGSDFFRFNQVSQTVTLEPCSVVEFYIGEVTVALGAV